MQITIFTYANNQKLSEIFNYHLNGEIFFDRQVLNNYASVHSLKPETKVITKAIQIPATFR